MGRAAVVAVALGAFGALAACGREPTVRRTTVAAPAVAAGVPDAAPAQEPEPELVDALGARKLADTVCPTVAAPYFFRIEKQGQTSYVLGTRHLGIDLAKFPANVTDALVAARLAVFETAPDDRSDELVPDPPHAPLPEALGGALWQRYQDLVGPELAAALVDVDPPTALIMLMALYEDKTSALDNQLTELALARQIPVEGLETSAFQEKLINRWLDLRALKAGLAVTDGRAEVKQSTIDDLTEYCGGTETEPGPDDEDRADMRAGGYSDAEIAQYEQDLVVARNLDWIPKLEKLFAKGGVFVAVGADHVIGTQGVVKLLEARGFRVTRVAPSP
jgi:hypothetical protein